MVDESQNALAACRKEPYAKWSALIRGLYFGRKRFPGAQKIPGPRPEI